MTSENTTKLNRLLRAWPSGTVGTLNWLDKHGVYQQLAHEYTKGSWLEKIGRGAYTKAGEKVEWPGGIYAIQTQLGLPVHVGGKSALQLKGFEHFVTTTKGSYLHLFSDTPDRLPSWFARHRWDRRISYKALRLFPHNHKLGITQHSFGTFEIMISTPERAIMEVLHLIPKEQGFEEARLLMEGLIGLRPKLVQTLLEQCRSVKVKRLFLYLAEHCNHAWLKKLDRTKINLGSGKRVIIKGGKLDPKYQITVERDKTGKGEFAA
jgi:hypothetical protein